MKILLIVIGLVFASGAAMAQSCPRPAGPPAISLPLDVSTVTTAGTAVNAIASCNAMNGGWVASATSAICVDQNATAGTVTGTPSTTFCLAAGQIYYVMPTIKPVSVNSLVNGAVLAGQGAK